MFLFLSRLDREEDREKFTRIYRAYRLKMQYTAARILRDEDEAENMVQETFLVLTDNLDKIDEEDSHRTWNYIVTILKNKCFNYLKRRKKVQYLAEATELVGRLDGAGLAVSDGTGLKASDRTDFGVSDGNGLGVSDGASFGDTGGADFGSSGRAVVLEEADLAAVCARRETGEILVEEIRKLKYPYKEILYLSYYNEMTSVQIGEVLGMSAGNVRQTMRRAKEKLKKALEQRGVTA